MKKQTTQAAPKQRAITAGKFDIIDIPEVSEDEQLVTQAGLVIRQFLTGIAGFFTTAAAIETEAVQTLVRAKALLPSTTREDDDKIREFVKDTTAQKKVAEQHWAITTVVHGFHRRMTAARSRATEPLDAANLIGNRLHNTFVDAEQRRAKDEQDRIRREAEAAEQRRRDEEQARLTAEAERLEAESPELSAREQRFVDVLFSIARPDQPIAAIVAETAARTAGYKNPTEAGARLLALPKIAAALAAKKTAAELRQQAQARKAEPLSVVIETVKADVSTKGDRTTWGAEVVDEAQLIEAVLSGKYGIPRDILQINHAKVNDYGKQLETLIDRWPGVRHKKTTKVI